MTVTGELDAAELGDDTIARRYGAVAGREWSRLLSHIALADGFLLCILIVPDRDGAELCLTALRRAIGRHDRALLELKPDSPVALQRVAATLLDKPGPSPDAGVWLSAVVPASAPDAPEWRRAWKAFVEGLNQQRNPLRREINGPLLLVGADWIVPLLREEAPDLWSVRSVVSRIEPAAVPRSLNMRIPSPVPKRRMDLALDLAPDPEFALREAARLAGRPRQEGGRARLLKRAADGLRARGDLAGAEDLLRQAATLMAEAGNTVLERSYRHEMGLVILEQNRAAEAEAVFRQSLAETTIETEFLRDLTLHELGRAVLLQDRAAEAEALFRQSLALMEAKGDAEIFRRLPVGFLGFAVLAQGRAAEAEALIRQSLALTDAKEDPDVSLGATIGLLGRAVLEQGRAAEAEALFRKSLALMDAQRHTEVSRGNILHHLGDAVLAQGRAAEAEALFRQALALAEAGGDTDASRAITLRELSRAVLDQGRAAEAAEMDERARKLAD